MRKAKTPLLLAWCAVSFVAFLLIKPPTGHGVEMLYGGKGLLVLSWFWVTGFLYYRMRDTAMGFVLLAAPASLAIPTGAFIGAPFLISIFVLVLSSQYQVAKRVRKACIFLGDVSYPLYLFHMPILVATVALGNSHASVIIALALIVSVGSLYLIDYPCRNLFRKTGGPHIPDTKAESA